MSFVQVQLAGGLGNRLFEYAFARAYAEKYGFELRCETCVLDQIFDLPANAPATRDDLRVCGTEYLEEWDGLGEITIRGMAQHQKNLDLYSRAKVCEWFRLRPQFSQWDAQVPAMDLIANLRLGDYTYACNPFVWISKESYVDCCNQFGLDKSKLYFLDGEQHYRIAQVPVERPWDQLSDAEKGKTSGLSARTDFVPDLLLMMKAKVLIRSNSTFAWWAAALGHNERVFSPDVMQVNAQDGIKDGARYPQHVTFVEGNHMPVVNAVGSPYVNQFTELHLKEI